MHPFYALVLQIFHEVFFLEFQARTLQVRQPLTRRGLFPSLDLCDARVRKIPNAPNGEQHLIGGSYVQGRVRFPFRPLRGVQGRARSSNGAALDQTVACLAQGRPN